MEKPSENHVSGRRKPPLKRAAGGSSGPGLSSFLRKNITRKKTLPTVLNTPMTHQGGLADFGACAATGRAIAFSFSFDEKPAEAPSYALE